jgi:hypothetical protein
METQFRVTNAVYTTVRDHLKKLRIGTENILGKRVISIVG